MIKVGDKVPSVKIKVAADTGGGEETTTEALFANKKVVLFGVPGAYTPTCSAKHLPGFVEQADALKAKGVDLIACVSVNDAFVMGAWGKDQKAFGKVTMIADGNADLAKAWSFYDYLARKQPRARPRRRQHGPAQQALRGRDREQHRQGARGGRGRQVRGLQRGSDRREAVSAGGR